jgi:hypothetical protein
LYPENLARRRRVTGRREVLCYGAEARARDGRLRGARGSREVAR